MRNTARYRRKAALYRREFKKFFIRFAVKWRRMRKKRRVYIAVAAACCFGAVIALCVYASAKPAADTYADGLSARTLHAVASPSPSLPSSPAMSPSPTPTPPPDPTLEEGMEKPEVNVLQNRLMELGYLDIDETTNYYGPATNYAVQLFQRQHGLQQDGICGPDTLEAIYSVSAKPYTLMQGTEGNDVDMLQSRLMELGYLTKSTGYYGTETIDAVKRFQEENEIGVDGKTGQVTLDLIYSADAKPTPEMAKQARRRGNIQNFLAAVRENIGKPYVWGAAGPNSFDCSGFVTYCLRQAGSTTGRLNAQGFSENSRWEKIKSMDNLEIGDLIFFSGNGRRVGHVGIYIGGGRMIDASSSKGEVVERSCRTSYWENHFVNARRPW